MEALRPRQQWDVAVEPMGTLEWVVVGMCACVVVVLYSPGVLDGWVDGGFCVNVDVKVDVFWDG